MKRKAHKLKKASRHPTCTGGPLWRRRRRWWPAPVDDESPGPPGIARPVMSRTRAARVQPGGPA